MRIYVPLTSADPGTWDRAPGRRTCPLPPETAAWAVTASARGDRPGEDIEDLEYEALQDAVYAALENGPSPVQGARRVAVIAGDVADDAVREAEAGGAFGIRIARRAELRIASVHVTEQGAEAVRADDTDPALLWFDVAESDDALDYLRRPGTPG